MVRWDLEREPGGPIGAPGFEVLGRTGGDPGSPTPTDVRRPPGGSALIRIPREYHDLRERDRGLAQRWRDASAEAFVACFDAGLIATGFTGDSTYVLTEGP